MIAWSIIKRLTSESLIAIGVRDTLIPETMAAPEAELEQHSGYKSKLEQITWGVQAPG